MRIVILSIAIAIISSVASVMVYDYIKAPTIVRVSSGMPIAFCKSSHAFVG